VASTIELIDKSSIDRSGQFHGSSRHVSHEELGQNSAHISPQVNAGNYVGWSSISFTAQTASDTSRLDLVFAAVRLADGLHVGSLEAAAQD
jgi:hypothetical protein